MAITVKNLDSPDETRTPDKTKLEVVDLGAAKVMRMTAQPGWTWADCIKPVVGGDSCQKRHLGVVISGRMQIVHDDGAEQEISAGEAYSIDPGHNATVTSDEAFVGFEFESATAATFATPSGGD